MVSWLVACASACALYAFGDWFLKHILCAETRDLISVRVAMVFSGTFAITSSLLLLVLYEVAEIVDVGTLRMCWRAYLRAATFALLGVAPWEMFLLGFDALLRHQSDFGVEAVVVDDERAGGGYRRGERRTRRRVKAYALATVATFVFVWAFLGVEPARGRYHVDREGTKVSGGTFTMFRVVSRTAVLGISLLGVLSGFGAVHFPYTTMRIFNRAISDAEVSNLERRLVQSIETVVERKKRVELLKYEIAKASEVDRRGGSGGGVFGRLAAGLRLPGIREGRAGQIITLSAEINALEAVNKTLFFELHDVNLQKERARLSRTTYGRFLELCGAAMFAMCSYRFIVGFKRLIFKETPSTDPITTAVHLFLANKSIDIDPAVLSQYLSLILIAFLVYNSMQNFVLQLTKLFFAVGGGVITTDGLVLFSTEMVGLFFLSSVLLVREQLPESYRHLVTEALGADLEFQFYSKFYDLIFMASAALTSLLLYARHITTASSDDSSFLSNAGAASSTIPTSVRRNSELKRS